MALANTDIDTASGDIGNITVKFEVMMATLISFTDIVASIVMETNTQAYFVGYIVVNRIFIITIIIVVESN